MENLRELERELITCTRGHWEEQGGGHTDRSGPLSLLEGEIREFARFGFVICEVGIFQKGHAGDTYKLSYQPVRMRS